MKQCFRLRFTFPLLALAATSFAACGLFQTKDADWDAPAPPSTPRYGTDEFGNPQAIPYTNEPGQSGQADGTGTPGSGSYAGTGGYSPSGQGGNSGTSGNQDGSYGYGSGSENTTNRADPQRTDGALIYSYNERTGRDGTTEPEDGDEPGSGYHVAAEFSHTISGWFMCELFNIPAGVTWLFLPIRFFTTLPRILRWLHNGLLAASAVDQMGCHLWMTGSVGSHTIDEEDVTEKRVLVEGPLTRNDLVGSRLRIALVNHDKSTFSTILGLDDLPGGKTELGTCEITISDAHLEAGKVDVPCRYGGSMTGIQNEGVNVAREMEDSNNARLRAERQIAEDENWWDSALDLLDGFRKGISAETGTMTVTFR